MSHWRRGLQLSIVVILAFRSAAFAQAPDLRPELSLNGDVREISVSPAGVLWISTFLGGVYRSDDSGRTWSAAKPPMVKAPQHVWDGDDVERVTFFDAKRGMIAGFIGEKHNQILLTEDGGATWKAVPLPVAGMWVYDVHATPDGHAWMGGSSGDVLASDDYGQTWRVLAKPFTEEQRSISVWFQSPIVGAAGSMKDGKVVTTRDGGRSWTQFETTGGEKVERDCNQYGDRRVTRVRIDAKRLVIAQCGRVLAAPLEAPRRWTALTADDEPLVHFDIDAAGNLIGVTSGRRVIEQAKDGAIRTLFTLDRLPKAMSVNGSRIVMIDETRKVTSFDGTNWHSSRILGKGPGTSWPIERLDRGAGDVLWGVSRWFLYRSDDGARTWERVAELPAEKDGLEVAGLHIQSNGDVLLYDAWGWVRRWDVRAKRMTPVPILNGLDVVGSFRRADVWLLYGGQQFRIEFLPTFVDGQRGGTSDYGFVAASTDGGRSWSMIDRWDDGGPAAAFLSDDDRLTLLSLGQVRQGTMTVAPTVSATMKTLPGDGVRRILSNPIVVDLLAAPRGWVTASATSGGRVVFRTSDGGRSWTPASPGDYPNVALYRLFDGTWLGMTADGSLRRWNGSAFEPLTSVPAKPAEVWVDSQGSLSFWSDDGSMHVLDVNARTFRRIGVAATP